VRLYSRPGSDLTYRFPLIVEALARLRSRSCIIDGEAVACDDNGVSSFDLVRHHRANERIFLYAFDLIELNGDDLRPDPLESRKATLEMILAKAGSGIRFNEHLEGDGATVFRHACKFGLEGIVSKRKDSAYRSGRSPDWLKMKNSAAPAVKREEEEWARRNGGDGQEPDHDLRSEDRRHVPRLSSGRPRALISSAASSNLKAQHLPRRGCIEAVPKFGRVRPAPTGEWGTAGSAWALD
jgi:hypothetical protein